jgi:hypothetical protein
MQPPPQPTVQPSVTPTVNVQPISYGGAIHGSMDLRSPLYEGLQASPWPASYKPITLPKFNGKTDPLLTVLKYQI